MNFWDAVFLALGTFAAGAVLVAFAADRTIARLNKQRATFADKVLQDSRELLATFDELRKIHNAQGLAYEACLKKNDELRRMLKRLVLSPESYTARAAAIELLQAVP